MPGPWARIPAFALGLSLASQPAAAFYCDPGGAPLVNHAPTGTATATTGASTAGNAIDGDPGTAWQGATGGSSVFTWEGPTDVVVDRVHVSGYLGSVFLELRDASDAVLASGSLPLSGSPQVGIFDAQGLTLRKVRLTLTPGELLPGFPALWIFELRIERAGTPPPPPLPGPGPEELSAAATFQGVGDAAGGAFLSRANGVSPDGRLVVGETETAPGLLQGFRFADGALATLGPGGSILVYSTQLGAHTCVTPNQSRAFAASNTGYAAGNVCNGTTCGVARFGGGTPEVYEPASPGITFSTGSYASDLTADGAEITGMYNTQNPSLPQWGQDNLFRLIVPHYTVLATYSIGGGVVTQPRISPDGDCIVATVDTGGGSPSQPASFGACGAKPTETATDVSAGGTHVVGSIGGLAARGIEVLGDLPGGAASSRALGVSDDGETAVGWGTTATGQEAFVWTAEAGMERLADRLASEGLDLTGWTLVQATGVSASGRTIVGWGTNPSGQTEGFAATLAAPASVPGLGPLGSAVAALLLVGLGSVGLGSVGLRRRGAARPPAGSGREPR
jgi:hypothetical protein